MDKPAQGINPKPPGQTNGSAPRTKGTPAASLPTGRSLPKGSMTKVPPSSGNTVK